jgi:hypothetical protein
VFKTGIDQLKKKNLTVTRFRKKKRKERKQSFKKLIYEAIGNSPSKDNDIVSEGFHKLTNT